MLHSGALGDDPNRVGDETHQSVVRLKSLLVMHHRDGDGTDRAGGLARAISSGSARVKASLFDPGGFA